MDLPIDDTATRIFTVFRMGAEGDTEGPAKIKDAPVYNGKSWFELDAEGHQRYPGDFEAQVGQGAITLHSDEHLAASDRGVVMFRTLYRRAIRAVECGEDPPCTWRNEADALIHLQAGNYLLETTPGPTS